VPGAHRDARIPENLVARWRCGVGPGLGVAALRREGGRRGQTQYSSVGSDYTVLYCQRPHLMGSLLRLTTGTVCRQG
jgi:hypothetical protein